MEIDPFQAETVRLILRLAREGDGATGPMGIKSITKHLNAAGIHTRDGGPRAGVPGTPRTGKSGRYRYYTCSTKARQGETGCKGRTVPMEKLDSLVADHIERRPLQPARLEEILCSVLHRREERAERRATHIAELRKRVAEVDAKLKRLYDAIEIGVADLAEPMLKGRVAELKTIRDQAHADAERAEGTLERIGPTIVPQSLKTFARQARKRLRTDNGGYRRDYLRALAQRVEVDAQELRIMGSKSELLRTLVAASSAKRRVLACPVLYRSGVPRSTKMSNIASAWRYDVSPIARSDLQICDGLRFRTSLYRRSAVCFASITGALGRGGRRRGCAVGIKRTASPRRLICRAI